VRHFKKIGQLGEEDLCIGAFARCRVRPAREENVEGGLEFSRGHGKQRGGRIAMGQASAGAGGAVTAKTLREEKGAVSLRIAFSYDAVLLKALD